MPMGRKERSVKETVVREWTDERGCIYITEIPLQVYLEGRNLVDAVPVVRCKDCKWHNTTEHEKCVAYDAFWVTDPNDYCAWGERREDG